MRKLLFLAVLGGVAYGLRKLSEEAERNSIYGMDDDYATGGPDRDDPESFGTAMGDELSEDERLDETLRESFPASDPPSMSR
jgi:hypothetical protein